MLSVLKKPEARLAGAKRVFVGMSGGVDSSVAAYLLRQDGFDVVGVHLRCWNRNGCNVADAEDARRVAEKLDIPFYVFDLEEEYKSRVVDYMVKDYARGLTPNPDVMCNREIKFGLFLKKAIVMGADYIATGHYVKLKQTGSNLSLYEAKDKNKDQSYFLWTLTQNELKYCLFPIGDYLKPDVRELAKKAELPTANKKDSQGLCFVGKVTLKEFLGEHLRPKTGLIIGTDGVVLGEHSGIHLYTVGQRHGIGFAGGKPYYVSEKNASSNTIVLAEGEDNLALYKKEAELISVNLIAGVEETLSLPILARIRYRQPLAPARIIKNDAYELVFDKPQKFIASGQSAVFYSQDGRMLGGGVIK